MSDYQELKRLADDANSPRHDLAARLLFQAAANPVAVLALIAENERLDANVRWQAVAHEQVGIIDQLKSELKSMTVQRDSAIDLAILRKRERDEARAEVEALRSALINIRDNSISLWSCETAADALIDSRKKTEK